MERQKNKFLIVNADDFGLSDSVNRGIIVAHKEGIVTSLSILANGPAFENGVREISCCENLGIGVHLNIISGRPVNDLSELPKITKNGSFFLKWIDLCIPLSNDKLDEIEREYRAQIEKVLNKKIKITHLDSEKHHHNIPVLFDIVLKLAKEYSIPAVRFSSEKLKNVGFNKWGRIALLNIFSSINKTKFIDPGIKKNDYQLGIALTGRMNKDRLIQCLKELKDGSVSELCCHPGYIDKHHFDQISGFAKFYVDKTREEEVRILTDGELKGLCDRQGIRLVNYSFLI